MKHKNTQKLTLAAMTAAAYDALSLLGAVFGLTFGPIQVRFSEALCLLPFLFPETADKRLIFRSMVKWSTSWPWLAHGRMLRQLIRRNDL